MNKQTLLSAIAAAALLAIAPLSQAATVTDATGDILTSYTGTHAAAADLDIVSSEVIFNSANNTFTFMATMNGAIGTTSGVNYVFGLKRQTAAGSNFSDIGLANITYNTTVLLDNLGNGNAAGSIIPAGGVIISGNSIKTTVSASSLAALIGPLTPSAFTWTAWARDTSVTGNAGITDFAPNSANVAVTVVPEPGSYALMALGLGALAVVARRRRAA